MAAVKHFISAGEVLAQAKNRHEETLLGIRLESLKIKEMTKEDFLVKQKKQLVEIRKQCLKTSGSSPDPEVYGDPVPSVKTNLYQKPWAYAFSDRTHNAVYKEIAHLPKRLPRPKTRGPLNRSLSAPASKTRPREIGLPQTNYMQRSSLGEPKLISVCLSENSNSNITGSRDNGHSVYGRTVRPQSCVALRNNTVNFNQGSGIAPTQGNRTSGTPKRPQTCQDNTFIDQLGPIRKASRFAVRIDPDPIIKHMVVDSVDGHNSEINDVTNLCGKTAVGHVPRYGYNHVSKEESPYVWFKGKKLYNYIKPEDRFKKDPLNLMNREKVSMKHSMTSSENLENSRKSALKAGEAFPKAARLRALNQLIEMNSRRKTNGPFTDYNAILRSRIEEFLESIDEFCETSCEATTITEGSSVNR